MLNLKILSKIQNLATTQKQVAARAASTTLIFLLVFHPTPTHASKIGVITDEHLNDGLVAHWSFDGGTVSGTTVTDQGPLGYDGTMIAGPTTAPGVVGQGMIFPNDNWPALDVYVSIGDIPEMRAQSEVTIAAWMKRPQAGQTAVVGKQAGGATHDLNIEVWSGGIVYCGMSNGAGSRGQFNQPDTEWHHYACVFNGNLTGDANRLKVYFDGVQRPLTFTGAAIPATTTNNATGFEIGRMQGTPGHPDSLYDEVRFYNRALSKKEVQALVGQGPAKMSSSSQPPNLEEGLVGHWSFDGGSVSSTTVTDQGPLGYDGSIVGNPILVPGVVGQGMQFPRIGGGDEYINFGDISELRNVPEATIAGWMRKSVVGGRAGTGKQDGGGADSLGIEAWSTGNFTCMNAVGGIIHGNFPIDDTEWHHYACVFNGNLTGDSNRLKGYVDGVERPLTYTAAVAALTTNDATSMEINRIQGSNGDQNARYDEIRYYDRALSEKEIQALYGQGASQMQTSQEGNFSDGLIGYWSFNGEDLNGTTVIDRSKRGNDGTNTNAVPTLGKVGQAFDFDGSSAFIGVADTNSDFDFANTDSFSLSAWVLYDGANANQSIIRSNDVGDRFILERRNTGIARFQISGGATTTVDGDDDLNDGDWHHVMAVYDAGTQYLYVDGIQDSDTAASAEDPVTGTLNIGRRPSGSEYFDGKIDEARVYNRAFSAAEVWKLYQDGR